MTESTHPLGLALSGGGSRAMAFHCGLLIALDDIGLLKKVNVLSTVSGGSVLGAAWMAHKTDTPNATINDFELKIKKEIISGILIKTYWRLIFNLKYAFSPIKLLQKNLEEKLNLKKEIKELKKYPIIVINTTILNHQQNGRFSQDGFSSSQIIDPSKETKEESKSYDRFNLYDFPLSKIVAASAAFPFGFNPVKLKPQNLIPKKDGKEQNKTQDKTCVETQANPVTAASDSSDSDPNQCNFNQNKKPEKNNDPTNIVQEPMKNFHGTLSDHPYLLLSDGGILENHGVQTLLKSHSYGTQTILLSDSETRDKTWNPTSHFKRLIDIAAALVSHGTLKRNIEIFYNKQNKNMREIAWLQSNQIKNIAKKRTIHFIRVKTTLEEFKKNLEGTPVKHYEYTEKSEKIYKALKEKDGITKCNDTPTTFNALTEDQFDCLSWHAQWQVYGLHAHGVFDDLLARP
jgi:hypothetical protein